MDQKFYRVMSATPLNHWVIKLKKFTKKTEKRVHAKKNPNSAQDAQQIDSKSTKKREEIDQKSSRNQPKINDKSSRTGSRRP